MRVRFVFRLCAAAVMGFAPGCGADQSNAAPQGQAEFAGEVQVLLRGPVHEAFAQTVTFDAQPGMLVPFPPPAPIEELLPEQKPEGDHVTWIPGYWAWDDERNDFLWVSGIWRALPPGRQWVPGYWGASDQRAQWTSGYWATAEANAIEYLSEPPATVEAGPNIGAPSTDHFWVTGSWMWHSHRYAWRSGYWAAAQPDWTWVPAYYVWTPRGYIFVEGYWDYSIGRRGVLFAPVYFPTDVYTRRSFYYSPATVIDLVVFTNHLFLRPTYGHYYFGDYYADSYQNYGFYPSYSQSRYGYDPIYARQRWEHRHDNEWEHRITAQFQHLRDHEQARPPHTLAAMNLIATSGGEPTEQTRVLATSLDQLANRQDSPIRFQPLHDQERQTLTRRAQDLQGFRVERQKLETNAAAALAEKSARGTEPIKVNYPMSPIVAKPADERGEVQALPKTHVIPVADPPLQPKAEQRPEGQPRPEQPQAQPAPGRSPLQPKAEQRPEGQPRPEQPQAQPAPGRSPLQPKAEQRKKAQPEPKQPGQESKNSPQGESKGKSKK